MLEFSFLKRGPGRKSILCVSLLLLTAMLFTACGGSKTATRDEMPMPAPSEMAYESGAAMPSTAPEAKSNGGVGSNAEEDSLTVQFSETISTQNVMTDRKLIKDGNVTLETLTFEESVIAMDQLIESFGGFSETRTVKGKSRYNDNLRSAYYIIRVPAESFKVVLDNMGTVGTVLESNSQGTDITDQYVDSQARVKTLKVQEQTLLDIMAKSTELDDVITLESRIAEVRYEIERIENTLKNYDRLVAYSRITVSIQEVNPKTETKPEPETLGDRLSTSFNDSLEGFKMGVEDFLVWFVGAWITLLFLAVIAVIVIIVLRRRKKKLMAYKASIQQVKNEPKE